MKNTLDRYWLFIATAIVALPGFILTGYRDPQQSLLSLLILPWLLWIIYFTNKPIQTRETPPASLIAASGTFLFLGIILDIDACSQMAWVLAGAGLFRQTSLIVPSILLGILWIPALRIHASLFTLSL